MKINPKIITLSALIFLFFGFSLIPVCDKEAAQNNPTPTPTPTIDEEGFSTSTVENKGSGDRFQLINLEYQNQAEVDRIIFYLDKKQADGDVPGYKVEELGQEIRVLLYDTRDVDENFKSVFKGSKNITGSGNILRVDLWYPQDDSMMGAKIHLGKTAGFRVRQGEDPLRLIIEVEKK